MQFDYEMLYRSKNYKKSHKNQEINKNIEQTHKQYWLP